MPRKRSAVIKPTEAMIQDQIMQYLHLNGAVVIRVNSGGMKATYKGRERFIRFNRTPGCADLICCIPTMTTRSIFAAIEVKRPGEKPRPNQETFLASIERSGGLAIVATSVEDLVQQFRKAGHEFSVALTTRWVEE